MKCFYIQNVPYFTFSCVLYTSESDVCVIEIFLKKFGRGPGPPGPSDATPLDIISIGRLNNNAKYETIPYEIATRISSDLSLLKLRLFFFVNLLEARLMFITLKLIRIPKVGKRTNDARKYKSFPNINTIAAIFIINILLSFSVQNIIRQRP